MTENKQNKWTLDLVKGILTVVYDMASRIALKKADSSHDGTASFNLTKLFPDWKKLTDVQKECIAYGIKQKLSDKTQSDADVKFTPMERYEWMRDCYSEQICKDGVWKLKGKGGSGGGVAQAIMWEASYAGNLAHLLELGIAQEQAEEAAKKMADDAVVRAAELKAAKKAAKAGKK